VTTRAFLSRFGPAIFALRLWISISEIAKYCCKHVRWLFSCSEYYNHSYELTTASKQQIAASLAPVFNTSTEHILELFNELRDNEALATVLRINKHKGTQELFYGRRAIWYALVRLVRPSLIVETGTAAGLGTMILAAALQKNYEETSPKGIVITVDNQKESGYLIHKTFEPFFKREIQDSITFLQQDSYLIDMLIHDSNHDASFEQNEYLFAQERLASGAIIISDNANETNELLKFARRISKNFIYLQDKPFKHWWPGDGIGIAY
jgi:predicted O-methyltransferase YrrM